MKRVSNIKILWLTLFVSLLDNIKMIININNRMGVYERDMYEDGWYDLCTSCHPCIAVMYYELLLIYGYV